jgi:L-alanine-DL-glutamate epimerase-like enolase superfamily enzyme
LRRSGPPRAVLLRFSKPPTAPKWTSGPSPKNTKKVELADAMLARVRALAEAAAGSGVRLMVDAEHTYFQPVGGGVGRGGVTV